MSIQYAFQCKNCGHLEEAGAAGEREVPRKCRFCGRGVRAEIDGGGNVSYVEEPENWLVLATASDKEKKAVFDKFKLGEEHITEHTPEVPVSE